MNSIRNRHDGRTREFATAADHLRAEFRRLDLLLHREILRLRARYQLSLDEYRGLYIGDAQIDRLIDQKCETADDESVATSLTEQAEYLRLENHRLADSEFPWCRLVRTFDLTPAERDLLLLASAPEIDLKYETLYAYLNNDVSRKWLTCDLALRVVGTNAEDRLAMRSLLMPEANLLAAGLLRWSPPSSDRPRWLAGSLGVAPAVIQFLLEQSPVDTEAAGYISYHVPDRSWRDVAVDPSVERTLTLVATQRPRVSVLEGRHGSGRRSAAEAFATDLKAPMFVCDLQAMRASGSSLLKCANVLLLRQRMWGAVLCIAHGELLTNDAFSDEAALFLDAMSAASRPVLILATPTDRWRELATKAAIPKIRFNDLCADDRAALWRKTAALRGREIHDSALEVVADRFVLTPKQIEDAVDVVSRRATSPPEDGVADRDCWQDAAREQSDHSLGLLAEKVSTAYRWRDLVLPAAAVRQLHQITDAMRNRRTVYEQWGFDRRLSLGKGLKVLFTGPSGTGKTMTAGLIARDLGIDLYRIDLSCVVSKYIGETEKNLDRIFRAAHSSNAILFFDEADALFGKRSEVKDAHDRYANVEIAYLLQKLEDHDGAVILATNLNKNIDEAFSRRMHYVVRFPLPDVTDRKRLWMGIFPPETPLASDIDREFIAVQFSLSGGEIRNVALDSAFRAAADGGVVTMGHVMRAVAQQLLKDGRKPSPADFRHYYALLREQNEC